MSDSIKQRKNFALIGASGYVAPRHMKAIKETGHKLIAALDPFDSVGIMDQYFPDADFFVEFERFDRHLEKQKRNGLKLDYLSICSPNYLHDAHIRFGLRCPANVICEKPLVLNPWNLDALAEMEKESGKKIYNILQLRLHPSVIALKDKIEKGPSDKIYDLDLTYLTTRGHWYYTSWKGDSSKSGGIATNIGVHFFDMLCWIFGFPKKIIVHIHSHDRAAGMLEFTQAKVRWFLGINADLLPKTSKEKGEVTFRSVQMEGKEYDFSSGFADLHTESYKHILAGKGFGLFETQAAIQTVYEIRNATPIGLKGVFHPMAKHPLTKHPFQKT